MLLVWDYDLTLTKIHTCSGVKLNTNEEPLENFIADPELVKQTFLYQKMSGHDIAIASYGRYSDINTTLERLGIKVDHIVTPDKIREIYHTNWYDGYAPPCGVNKVLMLNHLATITGYSTRDIILIDDSWANILDAQKSGYTAIWMKEPYSKALYEKLNIELLQMTTAWPKLCVRLLKSICLP